MKILTEIFIDEDARMENCEVNGIDTEESPIAYLQREFGWLEESGISLGKCKIEE